MSSTETILLETPLVDHAPQAYCNNPFKGKTTAKAKPDKKTRHVGTVQASTLAGEVASAVHTSYFLRFIDVRVSNEKNWPLCVLLSRVNAPLGPLSKRTARDEVLLRTLETQGEIVPLDIGPDGQWVGSQLPTSFEQQLFVFDPLVFASVAICKPSAARPPTALPQVVAHGVFQSYLPPEKSAAQVQAELEALATRMRNTVMEMEQGALKDEQLDLDVLQRNARELFRLFDQDKSNSIDFDEYKQMLAYRGLNLLDSKAMRLFQLVDDQKKGYIDEREFVVALYITNALRKADATAKAHDSSSSSLPPVAVLSPVDVFFQLDSDRDGELNMFEYEKAMQLLGVAAGEKAKAAFPKGVATITMNQFKMVWLELIDVHEELRKRGISAHAIAADDVIPNGEEATTQTTGDEPVTTTVVGSAHEKQPARFAFPLGKKSKTKQNEHDRLKRVLMQWITRVEQDELAQATQAKDEVVRLEKARREQAQDEKRALFAQQRHTETALRTHEALRERQEKIQRRKDRVVKERQAREEKKLVTQMHNEKQKRELHQRQVVQEMMATKIDKITNHKAKHGDDVLDLSFRQLEQIPVSVYKGKDAINGLSSLLIVNVSGNKLRVVPGVIFSHLFALQVLDVSDNEIDHLPPEIGEARDLRTLDARHNNFKVLPMQIALLRSLQVLNLTHNQLDSFGDLLLPSSSKRQSYCHGLVALQDLDLSYNATLASISETIRDLQALQVVRLRGCTALQRLPDGLHLLKNLLVFDLSASQQKRLGKHVFGHELASLRTINLAFNVLTSLPEAVGTLKMVQELDISNNALISFPVHLTKLHELVVLKVSRNKIETLPHRIGELVYLETLDLSRNKLTSPLPATVGLLVSLQLVDLSHNQLSEIPMEFGALINVRELNLSWNAITQLPDEIGCMSALQKLHLDHNKLTSLPDTIVLWQELETLLCSHNALSTPLSPSIERLQALRYLDLAHNTLSLLEPCVFGLGRIEVLNLASNKLRLLPRELVDATAGQSLQKLDLYNNKILAIPVEWSPLLHRLDVFSIGRNPMTLLPEKWSDHWRGEKWRLGDVDASTALMNGYSSPQVSEWVHDQRRIYPTVIAVWRQQQQQQHQQQRQASPQPFETGSNAFVKSVRVAMDSSSERGDASIHSGNGAGGWQLRYERIIRHYYYEFKFRGHEIMYESIPDEQQVVFAALETTLRNQQEQRANEAIASHNAFRHRLTQAYAFDPTEHRHTMETRRRIHHAQMLRGLQQETRQWNEIVHTKLPDAEQLHDAMIRERKKRLAEEMKKIARTRMESKLRLLEFGPPESTTEEEHEERK